MPVDKRDAWPAAIIEWFVLANYAFLSLDIYLAHSINDFAHRAEWIPLVFSIIAAMALTAAMIAQARGGRRAASGIRYAIGCASIAVGVGGMLLHLNSRFFVALTLKSLVYSAPFIAPLAYAGLGFVLLLNRMVDQRTTEWSRWLVLLAWSGFVGNFGLSLADHAQNGFFYLTEWIPVVTSAMVVGFLILPVVVDADRGYLRLCLVVLGASALVGAAGFVFHLRADLAAPASNWLEKFLYGAPIFAPMLFANLAILAAIGIIDLDRKRGAVDDVAGAFALSGDTVTS